MIVLDVATPKEWIRWRDLRLSALSEAPKAFCSSLSEWEHQSEQTWRDRLADVSVNFIALLDGRDAGMVSAVASDEEVELISMWVAPFARGEGVGDQLVSAVIKWSESQHAPRLILRVLEGNHRAVRLYSRHGFTFAPTQGETNGSPVLDRLMLIQFVDRSDCPVAARKRCGVTSRG
jgi:GNAT superfamily N-acetyltransferase